MTHDEAVRQINQAGSWTFPRRDTKVWNLVVALYQNGLVTVEPEVIGRKRFYCVKLTPKAVANVTEELTAE